MKKFLLYIYLFITLGFSYAQTKTDSVIPFTLLHYQEELIKHEKSNNKNKVAECLSSISQIYFDQGNYLEALDYNLKVLKLAEELKNETLLKSSYTNIGSIFLTQKDFVKATDYYSKALAINQKTEDKNDIAKAFNSLGNVYAAQSKHKEAKEFYQKALDLHKELKAQPGIAACLSNIGNVYSEQGDYTTATDYYFEALKIDEAIASKTGIACDMLHIGSFYVKTKKYTEAENYLLRALSLSDSLGDLLEQKDAAENLSILYSQTGKHEKAMLYYRKAVTAKDSLFNKEKARELTRHEMNFEFERKEAAIKSEQNKRTIIVNSIIAILLLIVALIIVLLQKQRLKRKKDKIIFEKESNLLQSQKQQLESELTYSTEMLNTHTHLMLEKSVLLEKFRNEVEELKKLKSKELYEEKIESLEYLNKATILTDDDWTKFQELFEQVYKGFFVRLKEKVPGLTAAETRLVCLTKLQLSTKQMADVLGVSQDTIKKTRYRLRKKLVESENTDIEDFTKNI